MVYKQAHLDAPDGRQYHVRYRSEREGRHYWTSVTDSLEYAQKVRDAHAGDDPKIFVREVTPWRELDLQ